MPRPPVQLAAIATLFGAVALASAADEPASRAPAPGLATGAAALVIDGDLQTTVVRLVGLDERGMMVVDEDGRRIRAPLDQVLAVLPSTGLPDPEQGVGALSPEARAGAIPLETLRARLLASRSGALELASGWRYPGQMVDSAGDPEVVAWEHPRFGLISAAIDDIARLATAAAGRLATRDRAPIEDVLLLSNGDRLSGLVLGLGDPVEIESADGVVETARANVDAVILANPARSLEGLVVWLDDGTVTGVERAVSSSGHTIELTLATGQSAEYELDRLRAVGYDSGRLVPLSTLEPESQIAVGDRRLALGVVTRHHPDDVLTGSAATLGAKDLELPGPMSVTYRLPRSSIRFAATASLPESTAPWGDCEIAVLVDGKEIYRRRLSQDEPIASINLPIDGRDLTLRLDPANYGPIRDRVRLHRPLILLAP
jgi:hypothetical protein